MGFCGEVARLGGCFAAPTPSDRLKPLWAPEPSTRPYKAYACIGPRKNTDKKRNSLWGRLSL